MKTLMEKPERLLELGGTKKDIALLDISGIALVCSLLKWQPLPFDLAWIAVVLCGVPIVLEAIIGLVTAFDIKADVLVSLALIASVCIGEIFAAGEVAFIMQLGGLLEELTWQKRVRASKSSCTSRRRRRACSRQTARRPLCPQSRYRSAIRCASCRARAFRSTA